MTQKGRRTTSEKSDTFAQNKRQILPPPLPPQKFGKSYLSIRTHFPHKISKLSDFKYEVSTMSIRACENLSLGFRCAGARPCSFGRWHRHRSSFWRSHQRSCSGRPWPPKLYREEMECFYVTDAEKRTHKNTRMNAQVMSELRSAAVREKLRS